MRKNLLLGAFLISSLFGMSAQTVVWSDNFDDLDISNWTLVDVDEDGFNWSAVQIQDEGGQPVGTPVLRSASWNSSAGALTPDNWAITPAIDLSSFSTGAVINFNWKVMAVDADFDLEKYTVYVGTSSDYTDLLTSDVTFTETLAGVNTLTARNLDISSFAGQTVYVGIRHYDVSDQFTMEIDDVSVVEGSVAGINENALSNLSVFPNPANDIVNVTVDALVNSVSIADLNGRTVKSVSFDGVSNASVNIADLASGMYMMNITSDKGMTTKKIMKN